MVRFRDLTTEDTGKYHCAVDKDWSIDAYTEVDLNIIEDTCCMKALTSVYEGETVRLSCKFPGMFKKQPKYFCKEDGGQGCKYSLSTHKDQTRVGDEKLSLHDNREGVLTVSISSFSTSDAGSYWCGVDMGDYEALITHVQLTSTTSSSPPSSSSQSSSAATAVPRTTTTMLSNSGLVGPVWVSGAVLIITIIITIIIIIWRCRSNNAQRSMLTANSTTADTAAAVQV
ncbi:CMRF35-like molecule 1 [Sardina pilchardus]|uniref:CMRF35-like molecule 1 n=1 Tax=Sardina pilchardus TaxID=27697 RepID=UPI002E0D9FBC